ncbi:MAG TPA: hypothetical protein VGC42_15160 [Kofleriaceae bacterium]
MLILCMAGCDDALDQRLAIVDQPRVIAVVAEPPEVAPGGAVRYTAVIGGPGGAEAAAPAWAFCTAPKPPTEDNAVSADCLDDPHEQPLGTAPSIMATVPGSGCLLFGPETPSTELRPRDPDPTGGYYQPVRVVAGDLLAFELTRITCHLPTAPGDVAHDYDLRYVANRNPTLDPIALPALRAGTDVTLTASWPAAAAEPYLFYDLTSQTLVTRREAMRLSWFATGGALAVDASAVGETDPATTVSTTWHTPAAGPATLWLVLRDSRGGLAVQTVQVDIAP